MPSSRLRQWWYWGSLAARLLVGGVWVVAGWLKLPHPDESVRAVRAYDLLPEVIVPAVGYALPVLEILIGGLLIVGLATRLAAAVSAILQVAFIIGIASAWARGLRIECGCFGGGGTTVEDATAAYPWDIARDVGLFVLSAALFLWPRTALSVDDLLRVEAEPPRVDEETTT